MKIRPQTRTPVRIGAVVFLACVAVASTPAIAADRPQRPATRPKSPPRLQDVLTFFFRDGSLLTQGTPTAEFKAKAEAMMEDPAGCIYYVPRGGIAGHDTERLCGTRDCVLLFADNIKATEELAKRLKTKVETPPLERAGEDPLHAQSPRRWRGLIRSGVGGRSPDRSWKSCGSKRDKRRSTSGQS